MQRIEINVVTGEQTVVTLSAEEEAAALAVKAAWDAENTQDAKASKEVDSKDRLQFEVAFDMENRMRAREGLGAVTRVQYRTALINRWKSLNP